jgi:CRP/FNR family transcriptional regulator, cyclic AMP receptor protein
LIVQGVLKRQSADKIDDVDALGRRCGMAKAEITIFDFQNFIAKHRAGTVAKYVDRQTVYAQGDPSDALFYIANGTVKVTIFSEFGKEAVIAVLGPGDFFGEGCLDGHLLRNSTITTTGACEIVRFDRATIKRALNSDAVFAHLFLTYILDRNQKLQADLIDQLFNSSEKRLARILMTLANSEMSSQSHSITIPINQEMLANMVGTTRSRINQFMNKFRKMGYIDYNGHIEVRNSLLNLILHDNGQNGSHAETETS